MKGTKVEYKTRYTVDSIKRVYGCQMYFNIAKETKKALLLVDVTQSTDTDQVLLLRQKWVAKSLCVNLREEEHKFSFTYDSVYNGQMVGYDNEKIIY